MTHLYHADINMPANFQRPIFQGLLSYTGHARRAAQEDRYGVIELPLRFEPGKARCIETEVNPLNNEVLKQVWRQQLDDRRDLLLVITPSGHVKTVWANLRSDKHRTLDKTKYVRA